MPSDAGVQGMLVWGDLAGPLFSPCSPREARPLPALTHRALTPKECASPRCYETELFCKEG